MQCVCLLAIVVAPASPGWANSELRPAARLVFPYYDIRPGTNTILLVTNVSHVPTTAQLTFYDVSCLKTGFNVLLSGKDIAALDLSRLLGDRAPEAFKQGFVDLVAGQNSLVGAATIWNLLEDWAIGYHPAAAQRLSGPVPFETFPTRLALPGFFTGVEGARRLDGLLILLAPNPTLPGGPIGDEAVQAEFDVFAPPGGSRSLAATGHQLLLPLSFFAPRAPGSRVAWLTVRNAALDDQRQRLGLVGLFIQTLVDPGGGGGMAGAIRLWGLP